MEITMTQEQKAKAYDKAIEELRGLLEGVHEEKCEIMEEDIIKIFPELKESEDERIRKELIELVKGWKEKAKGFCPEVPLWTSDEEDCDRYIAWLEKQGEQKPIEKVEPKFREGDWVVYTGYLLKDSGKEIYVMQVASVENDRYNFTDTSTLCFDSEKDMRLWTIQDAKDGDVLVSESTCGLGTWYCIFKSLDGDESMTVYCYLARDGRFETKKELCFDKDPYNTKPATKEQRDQLEKAMADAGYEWNAEKKELKKVEQKPAWSEEDENILEAITYIVKNSGYSHCIGVSIEVMIDWLKSLKDRVQPQNTWKPTEEQIGAVEKALSLAKNCGEEYSFDLRTLLEQLKAL